MEPIASSDSAISSSFSHIGLGRQHRHASGSDACMHTLPAATQADRRLLLTTPADTVLSHFRIVRQQDQALQNQRHAALQRLNQLHASVAAQQRVVSGRSDAHRVLLVRRNGKTMPPNLLKDVTLLADRARSRLSHLREDHDNGVPSKSLSRPATSAATGCTGQLSPQQWAPAPCSIACTSFRQSLPPHASAQSAGQGVTVARKVYTPSGGCQTSLGRRTAYSEVLRRVRSAHGPPAQPKIHVHGAADGIGPWTE